MAMKPPSGRVTGGRTPPTTTKPRIVTKPLRVPVATTGGRAAVGVAPKPTLAGKRPTGGVQPAGAQSGVGRLQANLNRRMIDKRSTR